MSLSPRLSIGIVGAGAIGSVVACRLAAAGNDVTLFARGARLAALREAGIVLHGEGGTVHARPGIAEQGRPQTLDVLFVSVKAPHLPEAISAFLPALRPDGVLVPLVNGLPFWYPHGRSDAPIRAVDPDGALLAALAPGTVVGTVVFLRASLEPDGSVRSAAGERLVLGGIAGPPPPHLAGLAALLDASGIATRISGDIRAEIWTKIALNLATNPLSVVCGATLDEMFHRPELLRLVTSMLEETIRVAITDGIPPATALDGMIGIGRRAGPFMTSMAQDQEASRPLELGAIVDSVLELADAHGCAMPVARAVADLARYRAACRAISPALPGTMR